MEEFYSKSLLSDYLSKAVSIRWFLNGQPLSTCSSVKIYLHQKELPQVSSSYDTRPQQIVNEPLFMGKMGDYAGLSHPTFKTSRSAAFLKFDCIHIVVH